MPLVGRAGGRPVELDCGLLELVRRAEAQEYVRTLLRHGAVECDDGTPLEELGAGEPAAGR